MLPLTDLAAFHLVAMKRDEVDFVVGKWEGVCIEQEQPRFGEEQEPEKWEEIPGYRF